MSGHDHERAVACLVIAHREGAFVSVAARSVERAIEAAERAHSGWRFERLAMLDRPDRTTIELGEALARAGWRVERGEHGDPAPARLQAATAAAAPFVAFLDGDDLWGEAWLAECVRRHERAREAFLHAEYNLVFGAQEGLVRLGPDAALGYLPSYQRVANYWDAMCFCARDLYLRHPMRPNRRAEGFAHEDQDWARRSRALGIAHETVPGTIHFKRRRMTSVSAVAQAERMRMHPEEPVEGAPPEDHAPAPHDGGGDDVPRAAAAVLARLAPGERERVRAAFDPAHYLANAPDLAGAAFAPFEHYLARAAREPWRDPSPDFSTADYAAANPDVESNPFVHWVLVGRAEGREGRPSVPANDTQREAWERLAALDGDARARVEAGFDAAHYLERHPDAASPHFTPLEHYLAHGWREGRDPSPIHATDPTRRALGSDGPTLVDVALRCAAPMAWPKRRECASLDELLGRMEALPPAPPGTPAVSAVLVSYQHARFLPERLWSIVRQTHRPAEIVALDDGSTDGSADLLRRFADASPIPVRPMLDATNGGSVTRQWRRGIEAARGPLVWLCESDDTCEPDLVERLVRPLADPRVGLAFGRTQYVDEGGTPFGGASGAMEAVEPGLRDRPTVRPTEEWFAGALGARNVVGNVGAALFRRPDLPDEVWEEAASMPLHADWFLYAHLAGERVAYDPDAVAWFRRHRGNFTAAFAATDRYATDAERFGAWMRGRFEVGERARAVFDADLEMHRERRGG